MALSKKGTWSTPLVTNRKVRLIGRSILAERLGGISRDLHDENS
jgi:hypothetical protein